MIIVAVIAIATLGGMWLKRRYPKIERTQLVGRALFFGIEAADRFQRVAEEIQPHRFHHARRVEVDDAAAHRIIARLAHRRGAVVAVELEPLGDAVHRQHVAGSGRE